MLGSAHFIKAFQHPLRVCVDGNANFAFVYEIHLCNLLILFINNSVSRVLSIKFSWHESKRKSAQEPLVLYYIQVEKSTKLSKYIREQVIAHNGINYFLRELSELIVTL